MVKVVSVGLHIVDILGRYVTSIPDGQNLALLDEIRVTVAGTAAGTSIDLAKLGLSVTAMGAVGDDELGNFLIDTMEKYRINTKSLARKKNIPTSATMLPIRPNGERPALHVIGANGKFCWEDVDLDVIKDSDYLHMGGTSLLSVFDGQPTVDLLKYAKENGVVTTFDLVAIDRPDLLDLIVPCLPFIDYFMPGLEEAEMMTGLKDRIKIIKFFLDKGAKHTVFKMGEEGSSIAYYDNKELVEIVVPIIESEVVDSTGCGDSYCAGFIKGLSEGWSLEKSAQLGTACGSLVISGLGSDAGIVDFENTHKHMIDNF
jgi:sugar/nucleoside kinase (ribokinase family)